MSDYPTSAAPLFAKRRELNSLRMRLLHEVRKVTSDLDHLDATIRLFEPGAKLYAAQRYQPAHRARRGELTRFILELLRDAGAAARSPALRWRRPGPRRRG